MATKKLSPDLIRLIKDEIGNYHHHTEERNKAEHLSADWFKHMKQSIGCYSLIQTITGLTMSRVDDLLAGLVTIDTYWNEDGTKKAKK